MKIVQISLPDDLARDAAEAGLLDPGQLEALLRASLKQLNPWLSDDNLHKAVRTVTHGTSPATRARRIQLRDGSRSNPAARYAADSTSPIGGPDTRTVIDGIALLSSSASGSS